MELYIEKLFIDNFYLTVNLNEPTTSEKILLKIFKEYGEVQKFINVVLNSSSDLEKLKLSNPLIANLYEYHPPISISSIEDHFFNNSKCEQTIILTNKSENWFKTAEEMGALCFSMEDFELRINTIINDFDIKIDLSDQFNGWEELHSLDSLPSNEIFISDPYILTDSNGQKIDNNLIPFLKVILKNSKSSIVKLLTKNIPVKLDTPENIKSKVKSIHTKLNRVFANKKVKFKTVSTNKSSNYKFEFHDRVTLSNFYKIECGKGFNLIPFKQNDSILTVDTIFDKFTYNRHRNLKKKYITLEKHLEDHNSYYFKYFPE